MIVAQFMHPVYSVAQQFLGIQGDYREKETEFAKKLEESLAVMEESWFVYEEEIMGKIEKESDYAKKLVREQTQQEEEANGKEEIKSEIEPVNIEVNLHE